jgi:hypothetical protein
MIATARDALDNDRAQPSWLDWAGSRFLPKLAARVGKTPRDRERESLLDGLRRQSDQKRAESAKRRAALEEYTKKRQDELRASLNAEEITIEEFALQLSALDDEISQENEADDSDGEEEVADVIHEIGSDNDEGDEEGGNRALPTIRVSGPASKRKRGDVSEAEEVPWVWKKPALPVRLHAISSFATLLISHSSAIIVVPKRSRTVLWNQAN